FEFEESGNVKIASGDRTDSKYTERNQHRWRRFMHLMHVLMRVSRLAKERQEQEPEHIKRCESSGDPTNGPEDFPVVGTVPGRGENHIFAEKTRQTGNAGDGERSNKE